MAILAIYVATCIPSVETGCVGNGNIQIQFNNSTYYTNESTGEICTVVTVVGCVKEMFDFGVFPLPTQPVSAEGMHVAIATGIYSHREIKNAALGTASNINTYNYIHILFHLTFQKCI